MHIKIGKVYKQSLTGHFLKGHGVSFTLLDHEGELVFRVETTLETVGCRWEYHCDTPVYRSLTMEELRKVEEHLWGALELLTPESESPSVSSEPQIPPSPQTPDEGPSTPGKTESETVKSSSTPEDPSPAETSHATPPPESEQAGLHCTLEAPRISKDER